ncbi:GNAT family N-acetyltransferase [Niallia sp. NCCP-28]|uniref:GNAT family N-acetyltransferase n=1 Tax=Niallia sp. NCCP-28 TaxID=2934712 RepID=UPI002089E2A2|nr:GNAT family N-acetyltransferase [Niallia sp. NCCP-28]GKU82528.1 acetyltransferase [Niallia sp. NCCP-28]
MKKQSPYLFKLANSPHEFEQIHQLNYETFVEEIPQHEKKEERALVDSFHQQNTYLIALKDQTLIGMVAIHDNRPFSLDKKLGSVERYLPVHSSKICEIRLLSIRKEYRKTKVFIGLMRMLYQYFIQHGYTLAIISGTTRELKLYKHMGFLPFAHLVGQKGAFYQPMYITKEIINQSKNLYHHQVSFLPGPVEINHEVKSALLQDVIPHRDQKCYELMKSVQNKLCSLTSSTYAQVLLGTGTLANDCIAAQLSLLGEKGLILSNGEFGERLISRADRFKLSYSSLRKKWGGIFYEDDLLEVLEEDIKWIWYVHLETSTGVLNSMDMISSFCQKYGLKEIVDSISSIGALPLQLKNVYLASGVSGKALGSLAGLSFVFHNYPIQPSLQLPPYLDLGEYFKKRSIPYTHSSYLLSALDAALSVEFRERYIQIKNLYSNAYKKLNEEGFSILTDSKNGAFPILTVCIEDLSSRMLGDLLKGQGYILHYESDYLLERNWIQIATIGQITLDEMNKMIDLFTALYHYLKSERADSIMGS